MLAGVPDLREGIRRDPGTDVHVDDRDGIDDDGPAGGPGRGVGGCLDHAREVPAKRVPPGGDGDTSDGDGAEMEAARRGGQRRVPEPNLGNPHDGIQPMRALCA